MSLDTARIISATERMCKIDGCTRPSRNRGMCRAHYTRWWRHGNPAAGRNSPGVLLQFYENTVRTFESDDCLFWPYSQRRGYPTMRVNGQMKAVHRLICEEKHGPPPADKPMAAHSCSNGHLGCCNYRHLRWADALENAADKTAHGRPTQGESHPMARLSENDVRQIRALRSTMRTVEIAKRFGVSTSSVERIVSRKAWSSVS